MRHDITESFVVPQGITCEYKDRVISCTKGGVTLTRLLDSPEMDVLIKGNTMTVSCLKGNKYHRALIRSLAAHMRNIFAGLEEEFTYNLEACNVHFPMTLKLDATTLTINNFLGEKTPRKAKILPGVKVEVKGLKITVKSRNREAAGQTAANIEKAAKVRNRDRRVFQDGIYITSKPGRGM